MILDEDTARTLQNWLVKNLEPICAAEPSVLSTYIIALLKNDKSVEDIRSLCVEELEDFLHTETQPFVNKLFSTLKDDGKGKISFVDSTPPPLEEISTTITHTPSPSKEDREYRDERDESDEDDRDQDHKRARRSPSEESDSNSRTREGSYESRKRRNRDDDDRYSKRERYSYDDSRGSRRGRYDRRYRDDDRREDDDKGRYNNKGRFDRDRSKRRCRDYDEKGVCMKGELCPYFHGHDSIVVTDVNRLGTRESESQYKRKGRFDDSYDPDKPLLYNNYNKGSTVNPLSALPNIPLLDVGAAIPLIGGIPLAYTADMDRSSLDSNGLNENIIQVGGRGMQHFDSKTSDSSNNNYNNRPPRPRRDYKERDRDSHRDSYRERDNHRDRENFRERDSHRESYREKNYKEEFDKAPPTSTANTLMITSVPDDLHNIDKLNSHFKEFGSVVNIQLKAHGKAFVQFGSQEEASKALHSPQAVLGNRFIKVFWAKRQYPPPPKHDSQPPAQEAPKAPAPSVLEQREKEREKLKAQIQLKELQKKKDEARKTQLEQTKQLLESLSKMKNVDPEQKSQLLKKVQSLTDNVAESLAKDTSKLTSIAAKPKTAQQVKQEKDKEVLDKEMDAMEAEQDKTTEAEVPATDAVTDPNIQRLQKRYASLQNMAASMGIETSPNKRGRPMRGRGGASMRGRKRPTMALDNRPTTLKLADLPEELRTNDALSKHFASFGEVTSAAVNGSQAVVQFANRRAAEIAFTKGRSFNNQPLQVAWNVTKPATQPTQSDSTEEVVEEVYQPPSTAEDEQQYNEYDDEEDQEDDDERSWKH